MYPPNPIFTSSTPHTTLSPDGPPKLPTPASLEPKTTQLSGQMQLGQE